jgi:hypothetical protein
MNGVTSPPVSPPEESAGKSGLALSLWCITAAFGTYFCMYAYRKPFTAAEFTGETFAGLDYKPLLVTSQVLGYMLSKFLGIKFIAEIEREQRARAIVILVALAQVALLFFGLVPPPYNFLFLFLNGLPLGMVFGLVLGFLEGRRQTEALTAGLCASFILADGVTKSVGAWLLIRGVSAYWMPFCAGLFFAAPLAVFVWMLTRIPPPSAADIAVRRSRPTMSRADRRAFLAKYGTGLVVLVLVFLLITILRSVRADFAPEIWSSLGTTGQAEVFTQTEIVVALGVLLANGLFILIRDNRRAFFSSLALCMAGFALLAASLLGLGGRWLTPFAFMVVFGLGLYLPYVAFHTTLFERLIALTHDRGNLGYLMYLADAFGYLGYVAVMFGRTAWTAPGDFFDFLRPLIWFVVLTSVSLMIAGWAFFAYHPVMRRQD